MQLEPNCLRMWLVGWWVCVCVWSGWGCGCCGGWVGGCWGLEEEGRREERGEEGGVCDPARVAIRRSRHVLSGRARVSQIHKQMFLVPALTFSEFHKATAATRKLPNPRLGHQSALQRRSQGGDTKVHGSACHSDITIFHDSACFARVPLFMFSLYSIL